MGVFLINDFSDITEIVFSFLSNIYFVFKLLDKIFKLFSYIDSISKNSPLFVKSISRFFALKIEVVLLLSIFFDHWNLIGTLNILPSVKRNLLLSLKFLKYFQRV